MTKRITTIPDDSCSVFVLREIPPEWLIAFGLAAVGVVALISVLIGWVREAHTIQTKEN